MKEIIIILLIIKALTSYEYGNLLCSSKRILDMNTVVNGTSNLCFKNSTIYTKECFTFTGLILCNPRKRYGIYESKVKKINEELSTDKDVIFINSTSTEDEINLIKRPVEIFYNGNWITNNSYKLLNISLCKIYNTKRINKEPVVNAKYHPYFSNYNDGVKYKKREGQAVYVNWKQPIATIILGSSIQHDVWFNKPSHSVMQLCNGTCELTVGDEFFTDLNKLEIDVYVSSDKGLVFSEDYEVEVHKSCPIPTNLFSPMWSYTFNCVDNVFQKIAIVCVFIGIGVLILAGIIIMLLSFYLMYIYITLQCGIYRSNNNITVTNYVNEKDDRDIELDDIGTRLPDDIERLPNWAKSYYINKIPNKVTVQPLLILGIICLLISGASSMQMCNKSSSPDMRIDACQYTFSMHSQDLVCTNNGATSTCTLDFNTQITFKTLGQTYCMNIVDDKNETIYIMQLKYGFDINVIMLRFEYYTAPWVPQYSSSISCKLTGACPYAGCPLNPSTSNRNFSQNGYFYSLANNANIGMPGCYASDDDSRTCVSNFNNQDNYDIGKKRVIRDDMPKFTPNIQCYEVSGGWSNGCGLPFSQSCEWTYYDMEVVNDVYSVFTPSEKYRYPILTGMIYNPNKDCYDSLVNISFQNGWVDSNQDNYQLIPNINSAATSDGDFSPIKFNFVMITQNKASDFLFGENKIIISEQTSVTAYGAASAPGGPIAGLPGDIQSNDESALRRNVKNWLPNSVSVLRTGSGSTFSFPPMGARYFQSILNSDFSATYTGTYPNTEGGRLLFDGVSYRRDNGALVGFDFSPSSLTIGVSTTSPVTMTFTNNVVCPKITFISSYGCSSCLRGVQVYVNIWSTCMAGMVSVVLKGPGTLSTTSVFAGLTSSPVSATFYTDVEYGDYELSVVEDHTISTVKFSKYYPKEVLLQDGSFQSYVNETRIYNTNDIAAWWNNLDLSIKIVIPFSAAVGIVIIISILIVVAFTIFKYWPRTSPYSMI